MTERHHVEQRAVDPPPPLTIPSTTPLQRRTEGAKKSWRARRLMEARRRIAEEQARRDV